MIGLNTETHSMPILFKSHFIDKVLSTFCYHANKYPPSALRASAEMIDNQMHGMLFMLIVYMTVPICQGEATHPCSQEAGLSGSFLVIYQFASIMARGTRQAILLPVAAQVFSNTSIRMILWIERFELFLGSFK
jgi:hypothetical protein